MNILRSEGDGTRKKKKQHLKKNRFSVSSIWTQVKSSLLEDWRNTFITTLYNRSKIKIINKYQDVFLKLLQSRNDWIGSYRNDSKRKVDWTLPTVCHYKQNIQSVCKIIMAELVKWWTLLLRELENLHNAWEILREIKGKSLTRCRR